MASAPCPHAAGLNRRLGTLAFTAQAVATVELTLSAVINIPATPPRRAMPPGTATRSPWRRFCWCPAMAVPTPNWPPFDPVGDTAAQVRLVGVALVSLVQGVKPQAT